jgi:membrane protease YdiL (CAAX protease family)
MLAGMRALWPGKFGSRRGQILAITLIAVLFGAMHFGMGPIAAVLATVVGWFLGLIIIFHRSIWPAVIAHGLFDATTFAVLPWAMEKLQQFR